MNTEQNTTLVNDLFFDEQNVRSAIAGNEPLLCGIDVARILGYARPRKAVQDHCKGGTILGLPTEGGTQQSRFIGEADCYRLILRSKAPRAEAFQDWLCEEVLPNLRRRSFYSLVGGGSAHSEVATLHTRLEIAKLREQAQYLEDQLHWQLSLPEGLTVAQYAAERGLTSQQVATLGYRMACAAKKHGWPTGTRPSTRGQQVAAYLPEHFATLKPLNLR